MQVTIDLKECLRCGHTWQSQVAEPKKCPHCTSVRWNMPRRSGVKK
jgi:predicted Zn-ribbon and HTH transcriptional regulator